MPFGHGAVMSKPGTGSAAAGLAALTAMNGFWDGKQYSGSGNLLNRGITGASGDMVLGASTAAPAFSVDHFTFDGVNDYMATAGQVSDFDLTNKGTNWTVGIILKQTAASAVANGGYISKQSSSGASWSLRDPNASNLAGRFVTVDVNTNVAAAISDTNVQNAVALITGGCTSGNLVFAGLNQSITTAADGRTGSSAISITTSIGTTRVASGVFQQFQLYGAFITKAAITAQNRSDIGAYYGITI